MSEKCDACGRGKDCCKAERREVFKCEPCDKYYCTDCLDKMAEKVGLEPGTDEEPALFKCDFRDEWMCAECYEAEAVAE